VVEFRTVVSYDLAMGSEPEIAGTAFHGKGQEAVQIGKNRHTFFHSLTFAVWNGKGVEREISC